MAPPIIEAHEVSKIYRQPVPPKGAAETLVRFIRPVYRTVTAVQSISLTIAPGEAVGYIGPNGAGKSTMIKMLTGILAPSSGRVSVMGRDPQKERRRNATEIGVVMGQRTQLWWDLPVEDSFRLHQKIYRLSDAAYRASRERLVALFGLEPLMQRLPRSLSLGERMRADIALALLHEPKILFLDEPTIGMDLLGKDALRSLLRTICATQNVTLLLTSHDLKDIEYVCDRIMIVNAGTLLFDGGFDEIKNVLPKTAKLSVSLSAGDIDLRLPGATLTQDNGLHKTYALEEGFSISRLAGIIEDKDRHASISVEPFGIEDLVRHFYRSER